MPRRYSKATTGVRTARRKEAVSARRRSARSATLAKKRGLNKTEKKQVRAIIDSKAESKYFECTYNLHGQSMKYQSTDATLQEVTVRAFAVGPATINDVVGTYGYDSGGAARSITAMNMARTFDSNQTNEDYNSNIPDGRYVEPMMGKVTWRLFRNMADIGDADDQRKANPYMIRMIRVKPRVTKYSDADIDPSTDLFVNQYGMAYGIGTAESSYNKNFGAIEMMSAKVNRRKYALLQDTMFQLEPPSCATALDSDLITTQTKRGSQKLITTYHRQPKKLCYQGAYNDAVDRQPVSGQFNELIFFHCAILGTNTKSLIPDVSIDCVPVATFKDI